MTAARVAARDAIAAFAPADLGHMRAALSLAERGRGCGRHWPWPNADGD